MWATPKEKKGRDVCSCVWRVTYLSLRKWKNVTLFFKLLIFKCLPSGFSPSVQPSPSIQPSPTVQPSPSVLSSPVQVSNPVQVSSPVQLIKELLFPLLTCSWYSIPMLRVLTRMAIMMPRLKYLLSTILFSFSLKLNQARKTPFLYSTTPLRLLRPLPPLSSAPWRKENFRLNRQRNFFFFFFFLFTLFSVVCLVLLLIWRGISHCSPKLDPHIVDPHIMTFKKSIINKEL